MFISGLSVCLSVIVLNIRHGAERGYKSAFFSSRFLRTFNANECPVLSTRNNLQDSYLNHQQKFAAILNIS